MDARTKIDSTTPRKFFALTALAALLCACVELEVMDAPEVKTPTKKVGFDISVTRDGEAIEEGRRAQMKSAMRPTEETNMISTMDKDIPFGLVGVDFEKHALVVDNARVASDGSNYNAFLNSMYWEDLRSKSITLSAYYPYVQNVTYGDDYNEYSIPYKVEETNAGPLVSKTVEVAVEKLNMVPLEFQHITNDIGYRICDVTADKNLQGLVHLRKLTAHNVAQAGVFVNDIIRSHGFWHFQGFYRNIVVFEGDVKVGVGSENEKFVGENTLESRMANSHRYYSIPDEILMGKQYVEVIYDVEGFSINNFRYEPMEGVVVRYPLYGLLPDNVFAYGRQYTFHIGIDLSSIYTQVNFAAGVEGWETKIYENNEEF